MVIFMLLVTDGYNYGSDSVTSIIIVNVDENDKNKRFNKFYLDQNYPNPFNPKTTIKYSIPEKSNVSLIIFDVLGSEIRTLVNEMKPQGDYEVELDGSDLPSGIYFYRLQVYTPGRAGEFIETKKMVLLK